MHIRVFVADDLYRPAVTGFGRVSVQHFIRWVGWSIRWVGLVGVGSPRPWTVVAGRCPVEERVCSAQRLP